MAACQTESCWLPSLTAQPTGKGLEFNPPHSIQGSCDIIKPKEGSLSDLSAEPSEGFSIDSQGVSRALSLSAGRKFFDAWAGQCPVQQVGGVGGWPGTGPRGLPKAGRCVAAGE